MFALPRKRTSCGKRRARCRAGDQNCDASRATHRDPRPGAVLHEIGNGPHQRVEPVGRGPRESPLRPKSHISSSSAAQRRVDVLDPALLRSIAATGSARSHLPRVACTVVTGTRDRPARSTARTMSPPWLTSATSASACSRRTARSPAPPSRAGASRCTRRVRQHIDRAVLGAPGRDDAAGVGALARRAPADRPRPRCGAAAAPRRRGRLDHRARPQRVGAILDDLAVDLLAARAACRRSAPAPRRGTRATDARHWHAWPRA